MMDLISTKATTWADGYQNAIAKSELGSLSDLVIVDARTLAKIFIDDYLSANR